MAEGSPACPAQAREESFARVEFNQGHSKAGKARTQAAFSPLDTLLPASGVAVAAPARPGSAHTNSQPCLGAKTLLDESVLSTGRPPRSCSLECGTRANERRTQPTCSAHAQDYVKEQRSKTWWPSTCRVPLVSLRQRWLKGLTGKGVVKDLSRSPW